MKWIQPGIHRSCPGDQICSSGDCHGWNGLLDYYFSSKGHDLENHHHNSLGHEFKPNEEFRTCMSKEINEALLRYAMVQSQYQTDEGGWKSWSFSDYFIDETDPHILAYRKYKEAKRLQDLANDNFSNENKTEEIDKFIVAANNLARPEESEKSYLQNLDIHPYPTTGNNKCFQNLLNHAIFEETDDLFVKCRPCYLECLAKAEDLNNLKNIEEFENWLSQDEQGLCARPCSPDCVGFSDIIPLYFPSSREDQPNGAARECMTRSIKPTLLKMVAIADEKYSKFFIDPDEMVHLYGHLTEEEWFLVYKKKRELHEREMRILEEQKLALQLSKDIAEYIPPLNHVRSILNLAGIGNSMYKFMSAENLIIKTGNNLCYRNLFTRLEIDHMTDAFQKKNWNICKPCYLKCLGEATDIGNLNTYHEIRDFFIFESSGNCLENCKPDYECHTWKHMFEYYFGMDDALRIQDLANRGNSEYTISRLHSLTRFCTTWSVNDHLLNLCSNIWSCQQYFMNSNTCLITAFQKGFDTKKRSSSEHACWGCHRRCLAKQRDLSTKHTYSDLLSFLSPDKNMFSNHKCNTIWGRECSSDCMNYRDMLESYLFRPRFSSEINNPDVPGTGAIPHYATRMCLRSTGSDHLVANIMLNEGISTYQFWFGSNEFPRNACMLDILENGLPESATRHDSLFIRCKKCYKDCIGRYSKDLRLMSKYTDFIDWISIGPDRRNDLDNDWSWKCSHQCDNENDDQAEKCLPFNGILSTYFFTDQMPTDNFRNCLINYGNYNLQIDMMTKVDFAYYKNFFGSVSEIHIIEEERVLVAQTIATTSLRVPTSGNNICFQNIMMNGQFVSGKSIPEQTRFLKCQPCYEDCMANKIDISQLKSIDDLMTWCHQQEDTSPDKCALACGEECLDWNGLLDLYFSIDSVSNTFTPTPQFRTCLTKGVPQEIINQASANTTFYLTFFDDNNECLIQEFYNLVPEIDLEKPYKVCKPCYVRCLAYAKDLNKIDSIEELQEWSENKNRCLAHGKICHEDCDNFATLLHNYFHEKDYGLIGLDGQSGQLVPNRPFRTCLSKALATNPKLNDSITQLGPEVKNSLIGNSDHNRNFCFQEALINIEIYKTDETFKRCRSCYLDCFSIYSDDLRILSEPNELLLWLSPYGPGSNSCVERCNLSNQPGLDCLSWERMLERYFLEESTLKPNIQMKTCLRDETSGILQEKFLQEFGIDRWHELFETKPLELIHDTHNFEQEINPHHIHADVTHKVELKVQGRNRCMQNLMYSVQYDDLQTDDQKAMFDMCKPCYVKCFRDAEDLCRLNTIDDLENWIMGGSNGGHQDCAESCHRDCYHFTDMLKLYFNDPRSEQTSRSGHHNYVLLNLKFEPHDLFKKCLTFDANENLMKNSAKNTDFYTNFFIDKNNCLLEKFESVNQESADENFQNCKPCYQRCLAESQDLSSIHSWEDMKYWQDEPKICKYHNNLCAQNCLKWSDMIYKFFFIDDKQKPTLQRKIPGPELQFCINQVTHDHLKNDHAQFHHKFGENEFLINLYYGPDSLKNHNQCLQSYLDRLDDNDLNFSRCKPCYIHCLAEEAEDLSELTTIEEFRKWVKPGPDVLTNSPGRYYHKCSGNCDLEGSEPCHSFETMISKFFFSKQGQVTELSEIFKMCLKLETSKAFQDDVNGNNEDYSDWFHTYVG